MDTLTQKTVVPSVVNKTSSDNIRIEMEIDAKELMDQISEIPQQEPTKKFRLPSCFRDIGYVVIIGLILAVAYAQHQISTSEQLIETINLARQVPQPGGTFSNAGM